MTSSFGDSGLSVFQAGHCDWQRPHSVQVVKSSSPFQVKSSTLPTPSAASSSRSSICSKSIGWPPTLIGCNAPSEVRPSACRLVQMLTNARNRCQATPIVGVSEMVIIHANEMRIFTAATTTIHVPIDSADSPAKNDPIHPVSGKWTHVSWPVPSTRANAYSSPRSSPMQKVTPRIVSST